MNLKILKISKETDWQDLYFEEYILDLLCFFDEYSPVVLDPMQREYSFVPSSATPKILILKNRLLTLRNNTIMN